MTIGFLAALTNDNVQPIACLACGKFGPTLAINPGTALKIESSLFKAACAHDMTLTSSTPDLGNLPRIQYLKDLL